MVKFGRHLQFYIESETEGGSQFTIVDYNALRDLIEVDDDSILLTKNTFIEQWHTGLTTSIQEFNQATTQAWSIVFQAISHISQARGAQLKTALKLYPPTVGISKSQDLLITLKDIQSAALLNSEALRKLVKKYDKNSKQVEECLSEILLPKLFSSSIVMGLPALESSIEIIRDLLDDIEDNSSEPSTHSTTHSRSSSPHSQISAMEQEHELMELKADELNFLQHVAQEIHSDLHTIVAHRGFHNPVALCDRRPLENSLAAFEAAWSNGVHLCECDVALTKDEKLVLAHDEDFARLALDPGWNNARTKVKDLTYKQLIALTLKNGVRAPLLEDVLRSAHEISPNAQLVIEIKPGNTEACRALSRLMMRNMELIPHIAIIMSFDLFAMHSMRSEMEYMRSSGDNDGGGGTRNNTFTGGFSPPAHSNTWAQKTLPASLPKLMLLTVADPPEDNYELWVDVADFSPIDGWLNTSKGNGDDDDGGIIDNTNKSLDGVYLKFQPDMLEPEGAASLRELSQKYMVGVWGKRDEDPDDYKTMQFLVRECGVSFYNTDLPRNFLTESR